MDGNRRWAKEKNLSTFEGHKKGVERVKEIIETGHKLGIKTMTFFCFSTENWKRSQEEIWYLMRLFSQYIKKFTQELQQKNIGFKHIGRKDRIPKNLLQVLTDAENLKIEKQKMLVQFAIDYGGRNEILRAVNTAIQDKKFLENEEDFEKYLDTEEKVDLLIRTSGEERISNYLLWQIAYAELMFVPEFFPDFSAEVFENCLKKYEKRKRRFGG